MIHRRKMENTVLIKKQDAIIGAMFLKLRVAQGEHNHLWSTEIKEVFKISTLIKYFGRYKLCRNCLMQRRSK